MLIAKIKDLFFNRRNKVEVESIDGDVNVNGNVKANNINNVAVVTNIKQISETILSSLKAGDVVLKQDSSGYHAYKVSFKKDGTGICLTYTDASVVETQSYDYTDEHWVYNSEDKTPLVDVENASDGTIDKALGLDAQGKLVKGSVSGGGGTQLYKHQFRATYSGGSAIITLITDSEDKFTFTSAGGPARITSQGIILNYYPDVAYYSEKAILGMILGGSTLSFTGIQDTDIVTPL